MNPSKYNTLEKYVYSKQLKYYCTGERKNVQQAATTMAATTAIAATQHIHTHTHTLYSPNRQRAQKSTERKKKKKKCVFRVKPLNVATLHRTLKYYVCVCVYTLAFLFIESCTIALRAVYLLILHWTVYAQAGILSFFVRLLFIVSLQFACFFSFLSFVIIIIIHFFLLVLLAFNFNFEFTI